MLVECVSRFRDLENGMMREVGTRFEVADLRFKQLNSTKYGTLVVEVPEAAEKPARRTRTRKAKAE
jgi:hypothetical protein